MNKPAAIYARVSSDRQKENPMAGEQSNRTRLPASGLWVSSVSTTLFPLIG
jgi:predicted site-specific integrase-resolvase